MARYDTGFYNSERYYDPTAGAALLEVIRSEKKKNYTARLSSSSGEDDEIERFTKSFCTNYAKEHGAKTNGKPKRLSRPHLVKKQVKLYEYCMKHCEDPDFSIEEVVLRFDLGSAKKVEQCFTERGDIWKIITSWNRYKTERKPSERLI